jgi:hypothetical protein
MRVHLFVSPYAGEKKTAFRLIGATVGLKRNSSSETPLSIFVNRARDGVIPRPLFLSDSISFRETSLVGAWKNRPPRNAGAANPAKTRAPALHLNPAP